MSLTLTPENQTLNWFGGIVAMMVMALLFFISFALVYKEIPQANQTAFATLMGFVGGLGTAVVGFFFGSSASNKKQADAIQTMATTAANAQAALAPIVAAAAPAPSDKNVQLKPGEVATVAADAQPTEQQP